jgi:hypothetical protein
MARVLDRTRPASNGFGGLLARMDSQHPACDSVTAVTICPDRVIIRRTGLPARQHTMVDWQGLSFGILQPPSRANTQLRCRDFVAHCVAQSSFLHENGIMRKRIVGPRHAQQGDQSNKGWLNLEQIATVEVTSEDPRFPVEYVFGSDDGPGWRAFAPGEQQIRIIFDQPVSVHHIELRFHETDHERLQEFVLRWSTESGGSATEIVRQQWNFSPTGSTTEMEQYAVNLDAVSVLELAIRPDLHRPEAVASLHSWRVG